MRRPMFALTVLAFAMPAIDAATSSGPASTLAAASVRKSVQGTGSIVTVDDDIVIRISGDNVRHLIRIDGSRYPGTYDVENTAISAEWDATSLRVVAGGVTQIALTTGTPGIAGFVVTSFAGFDALGATSLDATAVPSSDGEMTPYRNDIVTCSDGYVIEDDECYVGGPGTSAATYKCGFWMFGVETAVSCNSGYYACIAGCGSGNCRRSTCWSTVGTAGIAPLE